MSIMLASFQLHDHAPHLPQGPPGSGPPVSFARSGITAAWDPKFKSLLELAEARDVPVRWSCQTGVCHTCMTGLIDGPITYNPELPEMASSALLEPMPTKAIIAAWKGRARIPLPSGKIWCLAIDTSRTARDDLFDPGKEPSVQGKMSFRLAPRSSVILLTGSGEVLRDN